MKENLLQYIWQFQYFNKAELCTPAGDSIQIIHPGIYNTNQGPDFTGAKIKIGNTMWAGNVELHVDASQWNVHNHSSDTNYNNIILHVVYNNDVPIKDRNGNNLPTLELQSRISILLLEKYRMLMEASFFIPCEKQVHEVGELTIHNWKQRLVAERLLSKSAEVLEIVKETGFHWEECFWWLIAANFGLTVNSDLFLQIARNIPLKILARHKNNINQLEAILFGVAGLLHDNFNEKYPAMLYKEFLFFQKKYKLTIINGRVSFLRMRPANFPTIRLAQMAMLIYGSEHLFSKIKEATLLSDIKKLLAVTANDYWHYHYVFDEEAIYKKKTLGESTINNIIINTIIPCLFAYGMYYKEQPVKDKALAWLEEISPENNAITKGFQQLHFTNKNAFDSQFFIQLKNKYCDNKLCLNCAIGNSILKRSG